MNVKLRTAGFGCYKNSNEKMSDQLKNIQSKI